MSNSVAIQAEPAPIIACTIARDVQNFDLLIEDMETELGETWGDLSIADAAAFFSQPDAAALEFVAIAIDDEDESDLPLIANVIKAAIEKGIKVIVIAEEVSPIVLHQLLKMGAEEFVPYPLPEGALHDAIRNLQAPKPEPSPIAISPQTTADANTTSLKPSGNNLEGVLLPVHGLSGGTGASTFAVNLAWELANIEKENAPRVCFLDLDLQFGSSATYLDLPQRDSVYEMLTDTESMDDESFMQALLTFNDKLHVLTAPAEMLPLDIITPEDIQKILDVARANFDYVIVDMPSTVVQWTETVLSSAHVYFTTLELDMRSASNTLRFIRALKAEELPTEKLRYVLNRAPKFTDLSGKSRVKRLSESLDISIEVQLPDGGKPVSQAGDHGLPLSEAVAKNSLRKEILKLAKSIHDTAKSVSVASK